MHIKQIAVLAVPQYTGRYFGLQILVNQISEEIRIRHNLHCRGTLKTIDVGRDLFYDRERRRYLEGNYEVVVGPQGGRCETCMGVRPHLLREIPSQNHISRFLPYSTLFSIRVNAADSF